VRFESILIAQRTQNIDNLELDMHTTLLHVEEFRVYTGPCDNPDDKSEGVHTVLMENVRGQSEGARAP